MGVYASAGYLARKGVPHHPSDLVEHDCLASKGMQSGTSWRFSAVDGERHELPVKASLSVNHADTLVKLACHGAGVVLLPEFMAEEAVAQGRLVRLLPQWQSAPLTLYLVYGSRRNQAMAVRKLIEHLVDSLDARAEPRPSLHLVTHGDNERMATPEVPATLLASQRKAASGSNERRASPGLSRLGLVA